MCITYVHSQNNKAGGESGMKAIGHLGNKALKAIEKIARSEVKKIAYGWPPECAGWYHQPKRPVRQTEK